MNGLYAARHPEYNILKILVAKGFKDARERAIKEDPCWDMAFQKVCDVRSEPDTMFGQLIVAL